MNKEKILDEIKKIKSQAMKIHADLDHLETIIIIDNLE